jgi:tetratricopeptide (TPR) repeat protein
VTYDAFISYSHAKDKPIATALQSVVQRLGKPWYRRRTLRIFRDDTSLSATPHLWPSIERALGQSRFLIVLASPEAAASVWVNKEVAYWLEHKSIDTLLIALTAGELAWDDASGGFGRREGTPLPPALTNFSSEPKWVDLRAYRDSVTPGDAKFIELGANFAAAIRGIPKEDLLSEELRQQRRALTLAWSAAASLLVLAAVAMWQWRESVAAERRAVAQRDRAERTLATATGTANDLVMDVAVKIRNRLGIPVDLVREILTRAHDLLNKLSAGGEISPDLRHGIAVALRELATTLLIQGDVSKALAAAGQSRDIMLGLLAEQSDNAQWQRELSLSYNRIGETLSRSGRPPDALNMFRLAFDIRQKLADRAPDNAEWQRDLAVSYERIGDELFRSGDTDEAFASHRSALEIRRKLVLDAPDNKEWPRDLSVSYERIGDLQFSIDEFDTALENYQASFALRKSVSADNPGNAEAQRDLAISHAKLGDVLWRTGRSKEAVDAYRESLAVRERLAVADPGNVRWQIDLVIGLAKLGERGDDAKAHFTRALAIARRLDAEGKLGSDQQSWPGMLEQRLAQP